MRTGVSSGDHVGLEQSALQVDMVVRQGLVDSSQDLLGDVLATLQVVVAVGQNLGLNDGDDAVLRKKVAKRFSTLLTLEAVESKRVQEVK